MNVIITYFKYIIKVKKMLKLSKLLWKSTTKNLLPNTEGN